MSGLYSGEGVSQLYLERLLGGRLAYVQLVERLLYSKSHRAKAMQYDHDNDLKASDL